ncbi:MAG: hypothetical protein JJU36_00720 [Phycisphaeraceae bacterium]|nr:hypothetical protein [Phycisphaeraceae bacterium]
MPDLMTPMDSFRSLGDPDALLGDAEPKFDPGQVGPVNSHLHLPPNFSAFGTVREAMEQAAGEGIEAVGVNNYYGFEIYTEFAARAALARVLPLFGMEVICMLDDLKASGTLLNDPVNPGKMYLCGKALTDMSPMNEQAQRTMDRIRGLDSSRINDMLGRLESVARRHGLNVTLDPDAIGCRIARHHGCPSEIVYLQERHAAQALQEALSELLEGDALRTALVSLLGDSAHAVDVDQPARIQDLIRSQLMKVGKPAYVDEQFVDFESAHAMILNLWGIPCYPVLLDAAKRISDFESTPDALAQRLRAMNIHAVEFITFRNSRRVLDEYARSLRGQGFIVTAGTEHNTTESMPIEPRGPGGDSLSPETRNLFTEGACVLIAHQLLGAHGRPGWVDGEGRRTDDDDPDRRIARLAAMGAAALERYHQINR